MYCFYDKLCKKEAIHISPGEFFVSAKGMLIHSLVGECIVAILYDPVGRIGGMNQFLIGKHDQINPLERLVGSMLDLGATKNALQAKLIGGSILIDEKKEYEGIIGTTITYCKDFLRKANIEIISTNIGGSKARKIYFYTDTFKVLQKMIDYSETPLGAQMNEYKKVFKHKIFFLSK
ncbi:MAG: chemotaxis protein CheD [Spirochaetales bacterium]|nr:chemotaxis protein CheD [Spirochaetales bacterium]